MFLKIKAPGKPGKDNTMFDAVDFMTNMIKMLFDCGKNIFKALKRRKLIVSNTFSFHIFIPTMLPDMIIF